MLIKQKDGGRCPRFFACSIFPPCGRRISHSAKRTKVLELTAFRRLQYQEVLLSLLQGKRLNRISDRGTGGRGRMDLTWFRARIALAICHVAHAGSKIVFCSLQLLL